MPLYGILYWDWDTFQLLMLHCMETAVIAFFALVFLIIASFAIAKAVTGRAY